MARKEFLVFGAPYVGKEEIQEVIETLESGWWGTGPRVERFEKDFKKYIGSDYALAVNSCTAGLHLALKVLGIGPGDEVITTPMTFCSTANVIIHCGATPVFADIDIKDWNIDPEQIAQRITPKTKAIIPVHLHGRPCKMEQIMSLAKKNHLYVIEDAAHAVEARYKDQKVGNIGDITVFSFYVTKNVATAEGGMVTTNNPKWAETIKVMSLHGLSRDAYKRYSTTEFRHYEALFPGYKYNMTDIQAALGIHQLARVTENAKVRKAHWDTYTKAFKSIPQLIIPAPEEEATYHARHLYAILLHPEMMTINRDQFINELIHLKIGTGVHFYPVHLHKYYRETFGFKEGDFPNSEFVGNRTISLPLGANLTPKDIFDVICSVKEIIKTYKK